MISPYFQNASHYLMIKDVKKSLFIAKLRGLDELSFPIWNRRQQKACFESLESTTPIENPLWSV
jgi:hypothetical protein